MRKADLLDELRAEIGRISDHCNGDFSVLCHSLCQTLCEQVSHYQCIRIYFSQSTHFVAKFSAGLSEIPQEIPFGEGTISIAAARGGLAVERMNGVTEVCVPFYRGHHLLGQLVVVSCPNAKIDDEDVTFFCELASLLETKAKDCN